MELRFLSCSLRERTSYTQSPSYATNSEFISNQGGLRDAVLPSPFRTVGLRHPEQFSSLQGFALDSETVEGCEQAFWPRHRRPRLHCGQLRVRLVSEASSLPPAILCHHLSAQEARRPCADGLGSTKTTLQGARLGGSKWAGCKRTVQCSSLRCVGTLLGSRE